MKKSIKQPWQQKAIEKLILHEKSMNLIHNFKMKGLFGDGSYKSPLEFKNVTIDKRGHLKFNIPPHLYKDKSVNMLMSILYHLHTVCSNMYKYNLTPLYNEVFEHVEDRSFYVDKDEVSYAIQMYIFRMHFRGITCIGKNDNSNVYLDKERLLFLIANALSVTYMTKENATWAFRAVSSAIIDYW